MPIAEMVGEIKTIAFDELSKKEKETVDFNQLIGPEV